MPAGQSGRRRFGRIGRQQSRLAHRTSGPALAATERLNPVLNAVVLAQEATARRSIAQGLPIGPFRGVPFLLKDLGCLARGLPSHNGSRLFANTQYAQDSAIFDRIRATGVVTFGRTTALKAASVPPPKP